MFGIESLGQLQAVTVKLTNGIAVTCYNVTQMQGPKKVEYFVVLHPSYAKGLWFHKEAQKGEDGRIDYHGSKWQRCQPPAELEGFKSAKSTPLSEKQQNWWQRAASRHGVDPDQKITAKHFQILPVLVDAGAKLS